jgi:hypothetical protein
MLFIYCLCQRWTAAEVQPSEVRRLRSRVNAWPVTLSAMSLRGKFWIRNERNGSSHSSLHPRTLNIKTHNTKILNLVLYGCETRYLTRREDMVCAVHQILFGWSNHGVRDRWNITCSTHGGNAYKRSVWKAEGNRSLRRDRFSSWITLKLILNT